MHDNNIQTYNSAVTTIKNAILNAQYEAAKGVNNIQLTLYYSIGRFISQNSRNGKWGTHAIATISQLLKKDMPGLRGYSETSLKRMRSFYEEWAELDPVLNSSIQTDELLNVDNKEVINSSIKTDELSPVKTDEIIDLLPFNFPAIDAFPANDFRSIGFTHHSEILRQCKDRKEPTIRKPRKKGYSCIQRPIYA